MISVRFYDFLPTEKIENYTSMSNQPTGLVKELTIVLFGADNLKKG